MCTGNGVHFLFGLRLQFGLVPDFPQFRQLLLVSETDLWIDSESFLCRAFLSRVPSIRSALRTSSCEFSVRRRFSKAESRGCNDALISSLKVIVEVKAIKPD